MIHKVLASGLAALVAGAALLVASGPPIYDEKADAGQLIRAGIAEAGRSGKDVVLIFGANW